MKVRIGREEDTVKISILNSSMKRGDLLSVLHLDPYDAGLIIDAMERSIAAIIEIPSDEECLESLDGFLPSDEDIKADLAQLVYRDDEGARV